MMIWLSFADPTKPNGFLGAVIIEVDAVGYDKAAFKEAVQAAHLSGLNPGGEVKGFRVPLDLEEMYRPHMRKLLTRAECEILGERD